MNKKKFLKIVPNGRRKLDNDAANYVTDYLEFTFATRPSKGEIMRLAYFSSCREDLTSSLYANPELIPRRYLALLIRSSHKNSNEKLESELDLRIKSGVRILNILEQRHEWPLTKIYNVEPLKSSVVLSWPTRTVEVTSYFKLVVGCSRWRKMPHLVSLFALILRASRPNSQAGKELIKIRDYSSLKKLLMKYDGRYSSDIKYLKQTFPYWDILMGSQRKLLRGMNVYDPSKYQNNAVYSEGVYKLCTFHSRHVDLNDRFSKMAKEKGLA